MDPPSPFNVMRRGGDEPPERPKKAPRPASKSARKMKWPARRIDGELWHPVIIEGVFGYMSPNEGLVCIRGDIRVVEVWEHWVYLE